MMDCPRCDGQGIICKAKIPALSLTIYICDECEAIWKEGQDINLSNSQQYSCFMEQHGRKELWSEMDEVKEDWEK